MKAELVPENGDPPIPITRDLTVIGRKAECDVRIDSPSLSKRHCVVVRTDGLLVIRDLASTNGTKVKGQRIRWAALLPDDRVSFGAYKVRVYLGPDNLPSPSERGESRREGSEVAAGRTARAYVGAAARDARQPANSGFPEPSPLSIPAADSLDEIEIVDDEPSSEEAGWRKLIGSSIQREDSDDEIIIDLD